MTSSPAKPGRPRGALELVPRLQSQGYATEALDQRRAWVEEKTGCRLEQVGSARLAGEELRGNIENPIGAVQVPLGVAGPLVVRGEHADGTFYVPLATTEGALVRSYERGMAVLSRAGGAIARVWSDTNRVCPTFRFADTAAAHDFATALAGRFDELARVAATTTRHGRLAAVLPRPQGREVILELRYETGDAHGMNMIARASDAVCRHLMGRAPDGGAEGGAGLPESYLLFSGAMSEKRPSGSLFAGGKGKRVTAGAEIPARTVRALLQSTPEAMADLWRRTTLGQLEAAALGTCGQIANGLTALFIACGQDVANVVNSAVGITSFEVTEGGDLHAAVTLHSLTVATVGGGTGIGTARECLEMLGCAGTGRARKLAEIAAATVLAGELSMAAALASGQFVAAHEQYGRNRPDGPGEGGAGGDGAGGDGGSGDGGSGGGP